MKFKVGDRVKIIKNTGDGDDKDCDKYIGKIGKIVDIRGDEIKYPYCLDFTDTRWQDEELKLIEESKMKDVKFGIKFETDEDPVEFFKTKQKAEARVSELLEDSDVKKSEIYLFEIEKIYKVSRPITFKLMELVKGKKTKKTKVK